MNNTPEKVSTDNIQVVPSIPNIYECINYSHSKTVKGIVEDLIYGFDQEVKWYVNYGDNINSYDKISDFSGVLTNRTLARPLFDLCFEGDVEDPKDMFLRIKANPLFIMNPSQDNDGEILVIGVGGRLYFDGRIDFGQKYPFFDGKKINLVRADTKMIAVDYYGYRRYDEDALRYEMKDEDKENFLKGCRLLGLDEKEVYSYDKEDNFIEMLLKKLRLYKIEESESFPIRKENNFINVLYTQFQEIEAIDRFMKEKRDFVSGYYPICKSFYWDLPFVYLKDVNEKFASLIIEEMKSDKEDNKFEIFYQLQESCFGKKEIVGEVKQFDTYSSFLCNQQERLVEFYKHY